MTTLTTAQLIAATGLRTHQVTRWRAAGVIHADPRDHESIGVPLRWMPSEVVVARAVLDDFASHLFGTTHRMERARRVADGARFALEGHGRWLAITAESVLQCGDWLATSIAEPRTLIELRWVA